MPDRIIRDEILESERWLEVDNTAKLAFLACALTADAMGNMDAQPTRLYRLWRDFGTGTVEQSEAVLQALEGVDLVRSYLVDKKRFIHIPRFRQSLRFAKRLHPASPWCNATTSQKQGYVEKPQRDIAETSQSKTSDNMVRAAGVGVVVGVGVDMKRGSGTASQNPHTSADGEPKSKPFEIIPDQTPKPNGNGQTVDDAKTVAELAAEVGRKMSSHGTHLSKAEQLSALAVMAKQRHGKGAR